MKAGDVTNILLALLGIIVGAATFWSASRANRMQAKAEKTKAEVEEKGVDAAAYLRAKELYEGVIDQVQEQVTNLTTEVNRLTAANRRLEDEAEQLRKSNTALTREVGQLREEVAHLRNGH